MIETCPSQAVLSAFILGDLSEAELEEVAKHLEACTECDQVASRLDAEADAVLDELRRIPSCILRTAGAATDAFPTAEPASRAIPAETWGDFRIVREIGRGGMGVVREAYQGSLNRHVALKFLPERGNLARFRREAKAAGRLHHTNIVPVFGVGEHEGRPYFVMQYIAGQGLDVVLRDRKAAGGGLSDREAAQVGVQVAEALAYAHVHGVIHRDIKPSNLLMDEHGTVWVTDFGVAADASDTMTLTETGEFLGTLRYVAPERLNGRGDARADIYGLGVTLYELACGRPAYGQTDRAALIHQLLHQDPPGPGQVAPGMALELETIILKAMARDPAHRYATAGELAEDLRRFLQDRPILARRARVWERAARWCRRNPGLAIATSLLALALVATTAMASIDAVQQTRIADQQREAFVTEQSLRKTNELSLARLALKEGLSQCEKSEVGYGLLWFARALKYAPVDQPDLQNEIRQNLDRWSRSAPHLRSGQAFSKTVNAVAISPDGSRALAGSEDGTARLWELPSDRLIAPALRHGGAVLAVAFSPDGTYAVTVG